MRIDWRRVQIVLVCVCLLLALLLAFLIFREDKESIKQSSQEINKSENSGLGATGFTADLEIDTQQYEECADINSSRLIGNWVCSYNGQEFEVQIDESVISVHDDVEKVTLKTNYQVICDVDNPIVFVVMDENVFPGLSASECFIDFTEDSLYLVECSEESDSIVLKNSK